MFWNPSYWSTMLRKKFHRYNYRNRTVQELEHDLNEAWAEIRSEKLKRWIVTAALIVLWEALKAILT